MILVEEELRESTRGCRVAMVPNHIRQRINDDDVLLACAKKVCSGYLWTVKIRNSVIWWWPWPRGIYRSSYDLVGSAVPFERDNSVNECALSRILLYTDNRFLTIAIDICESSIEERLESFATIEQSVSK